MTGRHVLLSTAAALAVAFTAQAQDGFEPDERSDLSAGFDDAGEAAEGLTLEHRLASPDGFSDPDAFFLPERDEDDGDDEGEGEDTAPEDPEDEDQAEGDEPEFSPLALANTDIAFSGDRIFMGSYHGVNVYEARDGQAPKLIASMVCPGGQGDVSVHGDLMFMSVQENRARLDCGTSGAEGDVNDERFRGVRIFDISDIERPRQVGAVQTCRGSHTHTLVPDLNDDGRVYIYNQGTSFVREGEELEICSDGEPDENEDTALYSIDVIEVPLDAPEDAAIVNRPRIFEDAETGEIAGLWGGGPMGVAGQDTANTNHCHDITVYPELEIAGGACSGNGILLDISDPANPSRMTDMFDPDMAYWHSATFSNDGDTVVFTDEWGGGTAARCRAEDPKTWGANLIATIEDGELTGRSFHKLPTVQGETENCVAHNGSLIPVPGRDLFVQSWYQGGVSIMDFTDPDAPFEIAYFDRGPLDAERLAIAGHWSAYWHNGRIYGSEIARGLDVLRLEPTEHLSEAEIAAAESVRYGENNPQTQTRYDWEDSPDVARAYLDQLERGEAADADLIERGRAGADAWADDSRDGLSELAGAFSDAAGDAEDRDAERMTALGDLFERAAD